MKYYILNKPYGVLCQFTDKLNRQTLANIGQFPKDVYPVGRLDIDSEGLVLLTNDNKLKHRLLDPIFKHPRTYLVQVEGIPSQESLEKLEKGVMIKGKVTSRASVELLYKAPDVFPRKVPIRFRKNIPTSWLKIVLYEGKNRQVRKMTAAVGHPTLRLIRINIGPLSIENLKPGEWRELSSNEIKLLRNYITPKA